MKKCLVQKVDTKKRKSQIVFSSRCSSEYWKVSPVKRQKGCSIHNLFPLLKKKKIVSPRLRDENFTVRWQPPRAVPQCRIELIHLADVAAELHGDVPQQLLGFRAHIVRH